jgi:hypothetical protein
MLLAFPLLCFFKVKNNMSLLSKSINPRGWHAWHLRPLSMALLFGLIALSVLLLPLNTAPLAVKLSGLLILWISAVPALVYLQKLDQSRLPLLPFVGLFYIFFFALPVFATPLTYHIGSKVIMYNQIMLDGIKPAPMLLVASGVGAMILTYYLSKFTFMRRLPALHMPQINRKPHILQTLYWLLLIASLSFRFSPTLQSLPSFGQFFDPAGYLGLGGLFLQWRAGKLPGWQKILILLIILPLEARWRLLSTNLFVLFILLVFFVFILLREGKTKLIPVFALIAVVLLVGYSVSTAMRYNPGAKTIVGKIETYSKYVINLTRTTQNVNPILFRGDLAVSYDNRISPLVHRLGQIWVFQHVFQKSPQPVHYWHGESYFPLLTSFIPRVIYPDKPKEKIGAKFGFVYGITKHKDSKTSYNLPWITELLVNFGPIGVVTGMALFGLLFAGLDRLFNAQKMGEPEFLIGLTLIFRLWYQESNFSVMTGSMFPLFICLYIYFRYGGYIVNRLMAWANLRQRPHS